MIRRVDNRYPCARGHGRRVLYRGFALLELTIATAIICMMAIWAAGKLMHDAESTAEKAAGLWLLDIRRALDGMLVRHAGALGEGKAPMDGQGRPLYADPWSPTLEELKKQGHLPGAFPEPGPLGMHAVVRLWRNDACPGVGCRLDAVAYSGSPILRSGRFDFTRVAGIMMATEGAGGSVSEAAPDRLRGAAFDLPNPPAPGMAALPVGTVAIRAGGSTSPYLQARDSRNPEFLGDVSTAGALSAGGRLIAGEHLKLGATAIAGEPCPENGLLARETNGSLLTCVMGAWSAPGGFGGAFSYNSNAHCQAPNPRVVDLQTDPKPVRNANLRDRGCSCPPGFRAVLVSAGGIFGQEAHGWTEGYVCVR